jgi:hypothetical protein
MGRLPVTFLLDEDGIEGLRALDPRRDWREFQRGERAWVLQTHFHLTAAGYPARLVSRLPEAGIVVFHSKQRRALRRRHSGLVLVGIRGDVKAPRVADFEVVQNARSADGRRSFFIPLWPQPGLMPRDRARGAAVRRAAYKGFDLNLDPYFRSPDWRGFLAERRIEWVLDSVPFAERRLRSEALDWPDFRAVDLLLAVRPAGARRLESKPATKLYNAWLAEVPALLGPDPAFAELRRSPLDYCEVAAPEQAKSAVRRLCGEPELYRRMVEHGRARAAEFTIEATVKRWLAFLEEILPERLAATEGGPRRRFMLPLGLPIRGWARGPRGTLCGQP